MSSPVPQGFLHAARVLVGESVWEDAQITVHDGFLHVEFDAKDLDSLAIPLAALPAEPEQGPTQYVTHGRHCLCSACKREDWTNPELAPCGMHGPGCPARYQPLGLAGEGLPSLWRLRRNRGVSRAALSAPPPEGEGE